MQGVYVNSCHPGTVNSDLMRHSSSFLSSIIKAGLISTEDGAITQMYLATSPEVEEKDLRGQYYVPFAVPGSVGRHASSQENQTKLWDFSEKILHEKVPGYEGAGI
jgi:retinol dehydrogenase 12